MKYLQIETEVKTWGPSRYIPVPASWHGFMAAVRRGKGKATDQLVMPVQGTKRGLCYVRSDQMKNWGVGEVVVATLVENRPG